MAAFEFRSRRTRRLWKLGVTLTALAAFAVVFVSGSSALLSPSGFEGGDGNLTCCDATPPGTSDWANVGGLAVGIDTPSGTGDNSFGQGTKEDDPDVSVVSGSIPPNKSDLTRFYEASENVGGQNFLYLAWERTNVLGSANMDFEINQAVTPDLGTAGPHTINRTAGDLLVTYDFTQGGAKPTLALLFWVTSGATSQCFSSNKLPCWGNRVSLTGANSDGAINTGTVTDPIPPDAPRTLAANTFGEAEINLTGAGVFPAGACKAFGSVFLKSRSSASFTSEVKDFVAPVPVNISNCGEIKIIKRTDPRGVDQSFSFTSTIAGSSLSCTSDSTPASFTLNDDAGSDGSANTEDCKNVPAGSYTVTEGADPPSFELESLTCTATSGSSGTQDGTIPKRANISLIADGVVTCVYVNKQLLGAIKIHKTTSKDGSDLAGAQFDIRKASDNSLVANVTTNSSGVACTDGLAFGDYKVNETSAPSGYAIDDSTTFTVTVDNSATCGSGNEETISFSDTPLSRITVSFESLAAGNPTSATVQCTGEGSPAPLPEGTPKVLDNLAPGTYSCTVVVDP